MTSAPPLPPNVTTAAAPVAAVLPANQAVVPDPAALSPALAQLAVGAKVEAQVLAVVGQTIQLQTPQGPLTLQTPQPLPLPPGASLTLLMTAQGAQPQFRIATVNGQPLTASGQIVPQAPTSPLAVSTPVLSAQPPVQAGITALVLPSPTPPSANTPALPPGSSVTVRLLSVETPPQPMPSASKQTPPQQAAQAYGAMRAVEPEPQEAPSAQPQTQTLSASPQTPEPSSQPNLQGPAPQPVPQQSLPEQPVPAPQALPQPTAQAQPQLEVTAPPPQAAVPQAPTAPVQTTPQTLVSQPQITTPPIAGQILEGTVPDLSRPGSPMVQTPAGLLSLQANLDLPPGTKVTLQVVSAPKPPEAAPREEAPPPPLRKGIETLRTVLPQLAEQVEQQLPSLGHPRLAFQLMALTTAARQGKAAGMLENEPAALALLASKPELLHGLEEGLSSLRQTVTLPGSGVDQWQAYVLPFMVEGREQRLRLVVRDKPEGGPEAERREEEGTRFVIDLDMKALGPVQLDGLVKGRAKRFDLIIRTHQPIPETLRLGIAEVFINTLDGFGMTGRTSFQAVPVFIEPQPVQASQILPPA